MIFKFQVKASLQVDSNNCLIAKIRVLLSNQSRNERDDVTNDTQESGKTGCYSVRSEHDGKQQTAEQIINSVFSC